jgi:uncharacterized protein DUF892
MKLGGRLTNLASEGNPPKENAMKFETMEDLFLGEIQDLYDAEQRLVKALPGMAEAATSAELR